MNIAVDTYSFFMNFGRHQYKPTNPRTLSCYFDFVTKNKLNGIHMDPAHYDPVKDTPILDRFCKENNLYIELGAMEILSDDFIDYFNAAFSAGSEILRTFIGGSLMDNPVLMKERIIKSKEKLSHILPLAEKRQIKIAIENHIDITSDELNWLIDFDCPYVGVCYDSGNFMAMNENPLDAFHRFKDRIFCTHLKDACPKERYPDAPGFGLAQIQFCALGEGILPIKEILAELIAAKGKEAHITLEIPTPLQTSLTQDNLLQQEVDNVFKSIEFIRRESLEL